MGAPDLWLPPNNWRSAYKLSGGPLDALTAEQKHKLFELQRVLQGEGAFHKEHDRYALRRFLKARDWDVPKARQMWHEMLAFRASNRVDQVLHEFHFHEKERVLSLYPHGLHKVDREGRPVLVYKLGGLDLDALEKVTTQQRLTQFHVQEYERIMRAVLPACSVLAGRHVDKIITLIDVAGVRMRDIGRVLDLLSTYIKVDSNNYPETLGSMIIINAPMWFSGSFALVKRMLSAETQKKVQILGSNYQQVLHSLVAPENLLPEFGGMSSGCLADSLGPWASVLDKMRADLQLAATPAAEAGGPLAPEQQASPGGLDVRQRDNGSGAALVTVAAVAAGSAQLQVHASAHFRRAQAHLGSGAGAGAVVTVDAAPQPHLVLLPPPEALQLDQPAPPPRPHSPTQPLRPQQAPYLSPQPQQRLVSGQKHPRSPTHHAGPPLPPAGGLMGSREASQQPGQQSDWAVGTYEEQEPHAPPLMRKRLSSSTTAGGPPSPLGTPASGTHGAGASLQGLSMYGSPDLLPPDEEMRELPLPAGPPAQPGAAGGGPQWLQHRQSGSQPPTPSAAGGAPPSGLQQPGQGALDPPPPLLAPGTHLAPISEHQPASSPQPLPPALTGADHLILAGGGAAAAAAALLLAARGSSGVVSSQQSAMLDTYFSIQDSVAAASVAPGAAEADVLIETADVSSGGGGGSAASQQQQQDAPALAVAPLTSQMQQQPEGRAAMAWLSTSAASSHSATLTQQQQQQWVGLLAAQQQSAAASTVTARRSFELPSATGRQGPGAVQAGLQSLPLSPWAGPVPQPLPSPPAALQPPQPLRSWQSGQQGSTGALSAGMGSRTAGGATPLFSPQSPTGADGYHAALRPRVSGGGGGGGMAASASPGGGEAAAVPPPLSDAASVMSMESFCSADSGTGTNLFSGSLTGPLGTSAGRGDMPVACKEAAEQQRHGGGPVGPQVQGPGQQQQGQGEGAGGPKRSTYSAMFAALKGHLPRWLGGRNTVDEDAQGLLQHDQLSQQHLDAADATSHSLGSTTAADAGHPSQAPHARAAAADSARASCAVSRVVSRAGIDDQRRHGAQQQQRHGDGKAAGAASDTGEVGESTEPGEEGTEEEQQQLAAAGTGKGEAREGWRGAQAPLPTAAGGKPGDKAAAVDGASRPGGGGGLGRRPPPALLPSFTAWGHGGAQIVYAADGRASATAMYLAPGGMPLQGGQQPALVGVIPLLPPPGSLLEGGDGGLGASKGELGAPAAQATAAAQVNEYMRMWLQAASAAFTTTVRSFHTPGAGRQYLLDPDDPSSDALYPYAPHPNAAQQLHRSHSHPHVPPVPHPFALQQQHTPSPLLSGAFHSVAESMGDGPPGGGGEGRVEVGSAPEAAGLLAGLPRGGSSGGAAGHGPFNNLRTRAGRLSGAGGSGALGRDGASGGSAGCAAPGAAAAAATASSQTPAVCAGGGLAAGQRRAPSGRLQRRRSADLGLASSSPLANGATTGDGVGGSGGRAGDGGSAGPEALAGGLVGVGGGRAATAAAYEVYVDSEDEEGGWLLRRVPRQVQPRYGHVQAALRRVCCCL